MQSRFALKVVADSSHIGPSAFADFSKMRPVKTRLGELSTGDLEHAVAGRQRASCRGVWPSCFLALSGDCFHSSRKFLRVSAKSAGISKRRFRFILVNAVRIQTLDL